MQKAFEYEAEYRDKNGRLVKRRVSIGAALATTAGLVILGLTGHGVWSDITTVLKAIKWW
ncbi:MAG: hypothetical protein ABSH49_30610 [Bryobacteraceae bacterium]|jgi:hypothetical protein